MYVLIPSSNSHSTDTGLHHQVTVERTVFIFHIQEIQGSILGLKTGYTNSVFHDLPNILKENPGNYHTLKLIFTASFHVLLTFINQLSSHLLLYTPWTSERPVK
jgi:hypothetical protein